MIQMGKVKPIGLSNFRRLPKYYINDNTESMSPYLGH